VNCKPATVNDLYRSAIPLDRIDLSDSTYRITTAPVSEDLQQSIAVAGVINAPILKRVDEGWTVVSGFRRLEACRGLGKTDVTARILDDPDELTCVRLAIADNQGQRPLNIVELARVVGLLDRLPGDTGLAQRAGDAGVGGGIAYLEKADQVRRLPWSIQQGLLSDAIALPVALELGKLPPADALCLADLFNTLKPSLNRQREIMTLMQEISLRDGLGLAALAADGPVTAILEASEKDHRQKTEALRELLKQRRYPRFWEAQSRFSRTVKALHLEPGLDLVPPPHFEATTHTLTLRFDNPSQLAQRVKSLKALLDHPGLPLLFER